jgi:hypothetical protein
MIAPIPPQGGLSESVDPRVMRESTAAVLAAALRK